MKLDLRFLLACLVLLSGTAYAMLVEAPGPLPMQPVFRTTHWVKPAAPAAQRCNARIRALEIELRGLEAIRRSS